MRKLRLSKETLAELGAGDLRHVPGAASHECPTWTVVLPQCLTVELFRCATFTQQLSCGCHGTDNC